MPQMPLCNPPQVLPLSLFFPILQIASFASLPCTLFVWTLFVFVSWSGSDFPIERYREREGEKGKVPSQVLSPLSLCLSISTTTFTSLHYLFSLSISFFGPFAVHWSFSHLGLTSPLDLLVSSLYLSLCPQREREMKKMKRVAMGAPPPPPPSASSYLVEEEARARIKYQGLLQDYSDLLKETRAKKRRLQKSKEKKLKLSTEVKFLRKKYKSFMKNPSQESSFRLKKQQAHKKSILSSRLNPLSNRAIQADFSSKDKNYRIREAGVVSTSAVLDLHQAFFPNAEEMEEFQIEQDHPKMEKPKRSSVEGDAVANDLKLSVCRDVGTSSSHIGKRKISWQDQVALRV